MSALLSVRKVTVTFDGYTVLDSLDLSVDEGELRFLIGPNGAGKTTLLDVVTGQVRPRAGRVVFGGVDLGGWSEHRRARRGIGRKFQTPAIFPSLTAVQNLEVARGCTHSTASFLRDPRAAERDQVRAALEQVGLAERADARAGALSHGEKQWLELGMLLVQNPKLLLLDEPIAGMTHAERERTGQLLEALTRRHTLVVVEHDMEFMRQFARRVTVMHLGRVLTEGAVEAVQDDPRVQEIYLGPKRARRAA